jgi:hypothetical protein
MKTPRKEGDSIKKPAPKTKELQTESPISEKDEVKKAEDRLQNINKSSKK